MGNLQSRGGYGRSNRSTIAGYHYGSINFPFRSCIGSTYPYTRSTTNLGSMYIPNLPMVAHENQLLYELALQRYYIRRDAHLKQHAILCDLKCTVPRTSLAPARPLRRWPPLPPPPPPLRSTASDEQLERDAIARCCSMPRKRPLPPVILPELPCGSPCPKAVAVQKALAAAKERDALQRRRFWHAYVSGKEPWTAGAGVASALRMALDNGPPPCAPPQPPPIQPCSVASAPCFGMGMPLRAPLMTCPQSAPHRHQRPATAPGCVTPADVQRALESAWCSGASLENAAVAAVSTEPRHWMCRPPPPPPTPVHHPPQPGLWTSTHPAHPLYMPPPSHAPCLPSHLHPPTCQPPPQPSIYHAPPQPAPIPCGAPPVPGHCPGQSPANQAPQQPFFAEWLEVGAAEPCDVGAAVFADGVVSAAARGWQTHGGRRVASAMSRRWTLPAGVRPESLACFLVCGRLVIVSLPPPPALASQLASAQPRRLPPPLLLPFTYAQAPCPLCFMRK